MRYNKFLRMLCVMIVFSLTLVCSSMALAETDKEILFRDIKWKSSRVEISKETYVYETLFHEYWHWPSMERFMMSFDNNDSYGIDAPLGGSAEVSIVGLEPLYVGGYQVDKCKLWFVYLPEKDGTLGDPSYDRNRSAFIFAKYIIRFNERHNTRYNTSDAYNDLVEKLTSLYGNPDETKENLDDIIYHIVKHALWRGANGTMASITYKESLESKKNTDGFIEICYGVEEGDELMKQAYEAYQFEQEQKIVHVEGNTDGL